MTEKERIDLLTLIKENHGQLTKKQRAISDYLLEHHGEAPFLSARELAEKVGVSESTVIRYAFALGLNGYPALQNALRERLTTYITTIERLSATFQESIDQLSIFQKLTKSDIENIDALRRSIDERLLKSAIQMLLSAEHVYIVGLRISYGLAFILYYQLTTYIMKNVSLLNLNIGELADRLVDISDNDLLIAISFPRYTKEVIDVLNYAKGRRAKIISITDSFTSPLSQFADVSFVTPIKGMTLSESLVAPLSLIQVLVEEVTLAHKEECLKLLRKKEEVWLKFDTYYNKSY